jgi:hypothetical protein
MGELALRRTAAAPLERVPFRTRATADHPGPANFLRSEPKAGSACPSKLSLVALTRSSGES